VPAANVIAATSSYVPFAKPANCTALPAAGAAGPVNVTVSGASSVAPPLSTTRPINGVAPAGTFWALRAFAVAVAAGSAAGSVNVRVMVAGPLSAPLGTVTVATWPKAVTVAVPPLAGTVVTAETPVGAMVGGTNPLFGVLEPPPQPASHSSAKPYANA
jgi:hypothetical protein